MDRLSEIRRRKTTFAYASNVDGTATLEQDFDWLLAQVEQLRDASRPFLKFAQSCGEMLVGSTVISRHWVDEHGTQSAALTEADFVALRAALDQLGGK